MNKVIRIDIFKPSGKWYETLEIEMKESDESSTNQACFYLIRDKTKYNPIQATDKDEDSFFAVILTPNHKNSFPQVIWLA